MPTLSLSPLSIPRPGGITQRAALSIPQRPPRMGCFVLAHTGRGQGHTAVGDMWLLPRVAAPHLDGPECRHSPVPAALPASSKTHAEIPAAFSCEALLDVPFSTPEPTPGFSLGSCRQLQRSVPRGCPVPGGLRARSRSQCPQGRRGIVFHGLQLLFGSAQRHWEQPRSSRAPAATIVPLSAGSRRLYSHRQLSRQESVSQATDTRSLCKQLLLFQAMPRFPGPLPSPPCSSQRALLASQ